MPWTPPPVDTDPDAVADRILDGLAARLPGWQAWEGAPEVALAEEIGREIAVLADHASTVIGVAVAGIGETVFGVTAIRAVPATILVELNLTAADTLPSGFTVIGTTSAGVDAAFKLSAATALPAGLSQVTFTAHNPGTVANGVPAGPLVVSTASATVTSASAVSGSAGGADAETLDSYLDRLVDTLSTLRIGGVRAADLALIARTVAGVHRAFGVDLHDPAQPGVDVERAATVFPIDSAGQPVSQAVKDAVLVELEAVREVNFLAFVADPTYTAIDVTYDAAAETDADPVAVKSAVDAALSDYLSPATWGATVDNDRAWVAAPVVRYLEVARVAGSVDGVAHLATLTVNGGTVDVNLPGQAPLPTVGIITGTVA